MSNCYLNYEELYNSSFWCAFQQSCCVTGEAAISGKAQELLDASASLIDNYMGRSLCVKPYIDNFRGTDSNVFWTKNFPIVALTGFTYRSAMSPRYGMAGGYESTSPVYSGNVNGYYLIDDRTGMIETNQPLSYRNRFSVYYLAGYEEIPEDVKTAMKILTTHLSQQIDSGNLANPDLSVESVKTDVNGFTFGASKMVKNIVVRSMKELSNLPVTVFQILEKYKSSKSIGL